MSDAEKVKRLEAQVGVLTERIRVRESLDKSVRMKAEKWQVAKAANSAVVAMKVYIDQVEIAGLNMAQLKALQDIRDTFQDFITEFGEKL